MRSLFYGCTGLTTIPQLDTSNATDISYMFYGCTGLTTIPQLDTSNVTSFDMIFNGCNNLTDVPEMDLQKCTYVSNPLTGCNKLTNCRFRNIRANLIVGSGTRWGHLLTVDSLVYMINELHNVGAARTLTVGSANLEKLASVYVKLIDITDEMRVEDEYVDVKLPCVVCESTDEGAMLITEYASTLKQWTIK